ncbi:hypothetical protein DIPPA_15418 [Diplonema papillatum]|nr:hypothetical protein DIPPA_15418 [Diplonema papillatum]
MSVTSAVSNPSGQVPSRPTRLKKEAKASTQRHGQRLELAHPPTEHAPNHGYELRVSVVGVSEATGHRGVARGLGSSFTTRLPSCVQLTALIEETLLESKSLVMLALDFSKCFDRVPQGAVLRLAEEMGMNDRIPGPCGRSHLRIIRSTPK